MPQPDYSSYPPLTEEPTGLECRKWANNHPAATCEADRDILSYIAFLQSQDKACEGGAYPRYSKIAEKVKRTRRTVIRRINRLVELGVILKETRSHLNSSQPNRPCVFTVRQEGLTDSIDEPVDEHLADSASIVTVQHPDGYEIERYREYQQPSGNRASERYRGGSDTIAENVTPPSDTVSPGGVTPGTESVTGGVTLLGGGSDTVSPPTRVERLSSDLSISDYEYATERNTSDPGSASASRAAVSDDEKRKVLQKQAQELRRREAAKNVTEKGAILPENCEEVPAPSPCFEGQPEVIH